MEREALYFGYDGHGHYLHNADLSSVYLDKMPVRPPWSIGLMDTGLLTNGKHPDVIDGKVFWTLGGKPVLWFAFFWWDRSGDRRPNSNSGFYVRGFEIGQEAEAFAYACETFPKIVARQRVPLVLADYPARAKVNA